MRVRKACCDWTDSITRKVADVWKFRPILCADLSVCPPTFAEITTCEFTHMHNLDGWGSW